MFQEDPVILYASIPTDCTKVPGKAALLLTDMNIEVGRFSILLQRGITSVRASI